MTEANPKRPPLSVAEFERSYPVMKLRHRDRVVRYAAPNQRCLWRIQTLLTKEPGTIAWLDAIAPDEVLLDIGANVGMYTIYAAVLCDATVFACEPESQNYGILGMNIALNRVDRRVTAWCVAASDTEGFDKLHLSDFGGGGSCHSFGEALDPNLKEKSFPLVQGCYATPADRLVQCGAMPQPHHIKIDVDGFEHKVIKGAAAILAAPGLRSLSIEINPALAEHRWIIEHLGSLGFSYDPAQVARATRQEGAFEGVAEYVFRR